MSNRNIEIKARCHDLRQAEDHCKRIGAWHSQQLNQIDTYFHCSIGRLKLRQINNDRSELIAYDRPNSTTARESRYVIAEILDAETMKTVLERALGVRAVVRKSRELYLWHNVRIHLDRVETLGEFIELEAVISPDADEVTSRQRVEQLQEVLGIDSGDLLANSYVDLLELTSASPRRSESSVPE